MRLRRLHQPEVCHWVTLHWRLHSVGREVGGARTWCPEQPQWLIMMTANTETAAELAGMFRMFCIIIIIITFRFLHRERMKDGKTSVGLSCLVCCQLLGSGWIGCLSRRRRRTLSVVVMCGGGGGVIEWGYRKVKKKKKKKQPTNSGMTDTFNHVDAPSGEGVGGRPEDLLRQHNTWTCQGSPPCKEGHR